MTYLNLGYILLQHKLVKNVSVDDKAETQSKFFSFRYSTSIKVLLQRFTNMLLKGNLIGPFYSSVSSIRFVS